MPSLCGKVLESRVRKCNNDIGEGMTNEQYSPIFDILKAAILYELYSEVVK